MNSINGTIDLLLSLVRGSSAMRTQRSPTIPPRNTVNSFKRCCTAVRTTRRCTGSCSVSPASMTRWKPATPLSTSAPACSWGWLWAVWPFCLMRHWINKV